MEDRSSVREHSLRVCPIYGLLNSLEESLILLRYIAHVSTADYKLLLRVLDQLSNSCTSRVGARNWFCSNSRFLEHMAKVVLPPTAHTSCAFRLVQALLEGSQNVLSTLS